MANRYTTTIEELDVDDMDFPLPEAPTPYPVARAPSPPPTGSLPPNAVRIGQTLHPPSPSPDMSRYKKWVCLYPLYFDKSISLAHGRKVALGRAIYAPHGRQLLVAAKKAGFDVVYEPSKTHPRDFFNPGRVRVRLFDEGSGRPVVREVDSRKKLVDVVAREMAGVVMEREREPTLQDLIDSGAMPMLPGMGMEDESQAVSPTSPVSAGKSPAAVSKKAAKKKAKAKPKNLV
ncbi:signal recognition particle subunit [Coemansia interrupta]|uniref:Signal recognition particle subunit n=1 Tax=Coemansia interrupta TaxID=1126814 RepID=A0A9W8H1G5_9FUNG|nr:signal recognition particle subunit [Coemansia interrupta]